MLILSSLMSIIFLSDIRIGMQSQPLGSTCTTDAWSSHVPISIRRGALRDGGLKGACIYSMWWDPSLSLVMPMCSALGDRRFAPVEQAEVPSLKCTVSLLRCFQKAANWLDWKIGQHGLIIEFTDPLVACKRTATFLPEIPQQEGWSQQQTIDSLISKSGYTAAITMGLRDTLAIIRYESTHASLTYLDYEQQRLLAPMPKAVFA